MSPESFEFDDPLKRALDVDRVPPMSADFADRVIAATRGRTAPLPQTRPAPARRWRTARRLVIGAAAAGALATAAAATGLLEGLGVDLPSPGRVWSAMTGADNASTAPEEEPAARIAPIRADDAAVNIEGPIDTPEELEEAFRRIDEALRDRREDRRERVDNRLDAAIQRRRAQGLPAPTAEEEERLRARLEGFRERADERLEQRSGERREALRRTLEQEGEVTRENFINGTAADRPGAERLERFRQLPPEERRARIREWPERRHERLRGQQGGVQELELQPERQTDPGMPDDPPGSLSS